MVTTEVAQPSSDAPADAPAFGYTGEQVVEGRTPERIWQDHQARYLFSVPFAVGRRTLDAACGTGYGSYMLASQGAANVVGLDIGEEAVSFARARYRHPELRYEQGDVTRLPLADASVDLVTSFETIEHVDDAEATLRELTRVLAPNGILLISTPNRTVTSPTKGRSDPPDNEFHRVEYTPSEFDDFLAPSYRVLARYGQRMVPGILYRPQLLRIGQKLLPWMTRFRMSWLNYAYAPKHGSPEPAPLKQGWEARYLVYVCQKR